MMRGLSVVVCFLLISEAVFLSFSPRIDSNETAWEQSDHCELDPKSLIFSLYDRAVKQAVPTTIPVHTFMMDIYLRMRAADESDEPIAENTAFPEEPKVKGFIPVTHNSPRMNVVHMLFNLTGLRLLRFGWNSVSLVLTQRPWSRASGSMELQLGLDTGHNLVNVSHKVKLEPRDQKKIVLDISDPLENVTKPLMSGSGCVLLRLTLGVIQAQGHSRMRHKAPNKLFRLDREQDGALLVFYYNTKQSILQRPKKIIRKPRSLKQNTKLCGVREFKFPFKKIGYDVSYLLRPSNYTLNYCAGDCPALLVRKDNGPFRVTLYAFLKGKYHLYTDYNTTHLPLAKCLPNDYYRMAILYRNMHTKSMDVINLENAIVKSCQCA
ncbi:uncharacterized protein LOC135471367 isoform X2 [Liolophura sinensis]|uniref:uncharacterized protein LOC135471367 isoform X2 n=1 Tax=Liolophura sinensis TaxID=3198878 RepID=UPI003158EC74